MGDWVPPGTQTHPENGPFYNVNPPNNPPVQPVQQAQVPLYPNTPWEPTLYTDATQDEKTAAAEYTATYGGQAIVSNLSSQSAGVAAANGAAAAAAEGLLSTYTIPDLNMSYTTSPDLVPTAPQVNGSAPPGPPPAAEVALDPFFDINLAALMSCEQKILTVVQTLVSEFENNLQPTVQIASNSDSIFGQNVGYQQGYEWSTLTDGTPNQYGTEVVYDDLNQESIDFANSMDPVMQFLAKQYANITELFGQYAALLNNTGQLVAYTDSVSAFPPVVRSAMVMGPGPVTPAWLRAGETNNS